MNKRTVCNREISRHKVNFILFLDTVDKKLSFSN